MWQYYRDNPNDTIAESESFKCKIKMTGKTPAAANIKNAKIPFPLKYLSNFWRTVEILLIHCEINLILMWSEDCVIFSATGEIRFKITNAKLYFPFVSLSI